MTLEIRPATVGDVPAMRALGVRTWRAAYAGILSDEAIAAGVAEFWNEYSLGAAARAGRMLVAIDGGALAGLLESDRPSAAHAAIWRVCVAPEAQRTGVGRALVERALAAIDAPEVRVEHDARDAAAAAFFDRLGFRVFEVDDGIVRRVRRAPPR